MQNRIEEKSTNINVILILFTLSSNKGSGKSIYAYVQTRQSLCCSHTQSMDVSEN